MMARKRLHRLYLVNKGTTLNVEPKTNLPRTRSLQLCGVQQRTILNPSGSLYIMRGIQKYTLHGKTGGEGMSVSIIFRQLSEFKLDRDIANNLNSPVNVPWDDIASIPSIWKRDKETADEDIPMTTTWPSRLMFNVSRRHICRFATISSKKNIIQSMMLTSPNNIASNDARYIAVNWPANHSRTKAMVWTMNADQKFHVYCSQRYFHGPKSGYIYCGRYKILGLYHEDSNDYFMLIKNG